MLTPAQCDRALLPRRPQFEVRCFRRGQRPMQVERGLLPDRRGHLPEQN